MMKLDFLNSGRSSNAGKEKIGGVENLAFQEADLKSLFVSSIFLITVEHSMFFTYT